MAAFSSARWCGWSTPDSWLSAGGGGCGGGVCDGGPLTNHSTPWLHATMQPSTAPHHNKFHRDKSIGYSCVTTGGCCLLRPLTHALTQTIVLVGRSASTTNTSFSSLAARRFGSKFGTSRNAGMPSGGRACAVPTASCASTTSRMQSRWNMRPRPRCDSAGGQQLRPRRSPSCDVGGRPAACELLVVVVVVVVVVVGCNR